MNTNQNNELNQQYPHPETISFEDENGQLLDYTSIKDFVYKGKRFVVFKSDSTADTSIVEAFYNEGQWELEMIEESMEQEVQDFSRTVKTVAAGIAPVAVAVLPDPPKQEESKLTMKEIQEHLDKKYAIASGLPAWDILPPSLLISRNKRA